MALSKINILFIESDTAYIKQLESHLLINEKQQFILKHTDKLSNAFDLLTDNFFDVILVDLTLPDSRGLETFLKLKSRVSDIPIIILSTNEDTAIALETLRRGAQDFLVKGKFEIKNIAQYVFYAIERNQSALKRSIQSALHLLMAKQTANAISAQTLQGMDPSQIETSSYFPGIVFQLLLKQDGSLYFPFISKNVEVFDGITAESIMLEPSLVFTNIITEDLNKVQDYIDNTAKTLTTGSIEFRIKTSTGQIFWLRASASPSKMPNGDIIWNGITFDITEQKQTEEMTARLQRAEQSEDFIATLAHDLKVPLVGADRMLELLVNGALGELKPEQDESLRMLKRSNERLLAMLQTLLDVYRYEAGVLSLDFAKVDISQILDISIGFLEPEAKRREVNICCNLPNSISSIWADETAIKRVTQNVIHNAIKFTPQNGKIEINYEEDNGSVIIHVFNTGSYIKPSEQAKLFQRFWQGESGKRYVASTGLGLYLCRQIIEAHNGSITCKSDENKGTTFSITLPSAS